MRIPSVIRKVKQLILSPERISNALRSSNNLSAELVSANTAVVSSNNYNNNLHLYSANLYMNIFGCALQYCYIKFMLKVTKA